MGRRGPPPDPTVIRLLKGNPGKRAISADEPKPRVKAPPCPPELNDAAKKEWRRVSRLLVKLGLLTEVDRAALAGYCDAYATWITSAEKIQATGMVIVYKGLPMQSPWVAIHANAGKLMLRFLQEFGLSPSSRSRVKGEKPPETDAFEDFLRGRRSA